jgi:DNA-binding MarR family transcriptional regulator
MSVGPISKKEVDSFILNEIESVPHIEALLILRNRRSESFSIEQIAAQLYIPPESAQNILQDLVRRALVTSLSEEDSRYQYFSSPEREALMQEVEITYRRELVRVANMIHSKASNAVRDFARAFRITKEKD